MIRTNGKPTVAWAPRVEADESENELDELAVIYEGLRRGLTRAGLPAEEAEAMAARFVARERMAA